MNAITHEFIDVSQLEVEALRKSLNVPLIGSSASTFYITGQIVLLHFSTRSLLENVLKEVESSHVMIDDGQLVAKLQQILDKTRDVYQRIGDLLQYNASIGCIEKIVLHFNRSLLKKIFNCFDLVITNITEHDVDVENSYSKPFDSVDDLMKHLNSWPKSVQVGLSLKR